MVEQVVFWAVQGFISSLLFIVAYFLRDTKKQIEQTLLQRKEETDKLRDDLHEMKATLPQSYVFREDYIRTMADFNRKLDRLLEHNGGRG